MLIANEYDFYENGKTLSTLRNENGGRLSEKEVKKIVKELESLEI